MLRMDDDRLEWAALDPLILSGEKLRFLAKVRLATGSELLEALEILQQRYDVLRKSRPTEFHCSHEEYWKGFHS